MAREAFLGFTFAGKHSSDFGIIRVINGNRIKEDLFPESADVTQNIEGADGTLYYGTNYKKRDFTVDFAFDNMTEAKKRDMQKWLSIKEPRDLIFDEKEDIKYSAKITGKTTLSYIPFDDGNNGTIYKGEGTIVFTCYNPFGRKEVQANSFAQVLPTGSGYKVTVENNGDLETRPVFTVSSKGINSILEIRKDNKDGELLMKLKNPTPNSTNTNGEEIFIDCKKFLIYDSSGNIYNDKIVEGDFFSIPSGGEWTLHFNLTTSTLSSLSYEELYY